jgi:hypothetical protein
MDANDKLYNYMINSSFLNDRRFPDSDPISLKKFKQDMLTSKKYHSAGVYMWLFVILLLMVILVSINTTM